MGWEGEIGGVCRVFFLEFFENSFLGRDGESVG